MASFFTADKINQLKAGSTRAHSAILDQSPSKRRRLMIEDGRPSTLLGNEGAPIASLTEISDDNMSAGKGYVTDHDGINPDILFISSCLTHTFSYFIEDIQQRILELISPQPTAASSDPSLPIANPVVPSSILSPTPEIQLPFMAPTTGVNGFAPNSQPIVLPPSTIQPNVSPLQPQQPFIPNYPVSSLGPSVDALSEHIDSVGDDLQSLLSQSIAENDGNEFGPNDVLDVDDFLEKYFPNNGSLVNDSSST